MAYYTHYSQGKLYFPSLSNFPLHITAICKDIILILNMFDIFGSGWNKMRERMLECNQTGHS